MASLPRSQILPLSLPTDKPGNLDPTIVSRQAASLGAPHLTPGNDSYVQRRLSMCSETNIGTPTCRSIGEQPLLPQWQMGTTNYGSTSSSGMNAALISSGSSSATLCSIVADNPGQGGFLDKKVTEETPLITKISDCHEEVIITKTKFLLGISEKQFWFIFMGILITNFICAFDSTVMASTHTSVTSAFNSSNSASWLSTSFLLTSTSFQPIYGRASDLLGRRIPFIVGLVLFTLGTLWCAAAQNIECFIAARAICGVGCGGIWTMGSILLSDIIPIEIRGTYQSWINLTYGLGSMLGAALGGLMCDSLGWRGAFGVQVPPALLCTLIIAYTAPDVSALSYSQQNPSRKAKFPRFDFGGCILLLLSTALLVLGLSTAGNVFPWKSAVVISFFVIGSVLWVFFILVERMAEAPIMPLKMIWSRPRSYLVFSNFWHYICINTILFNLPLYFQAVCLTSATVAGTRLLAASISTTISSVCTGFIITATGSIRPTLVLGSGLLLLGPLLLANMKPTFSDFHYFLIIVPAMLGFGFDTPSATMGMLALSTQKDQAVATSTMIQWRSLGSVVGVATSSLVVQNFLRRGLAREVDGSGWGASKEEDERVREIARRSVEEVARLNDGYRRQVVKAYERALLGAFWWAVIAAVIGGAMVLMVHLPKLAGVEKYRMLEEMVEVGDGEDGEETEG